MTQAGRRRGDVWEEQETRSCWRMKNWLLITPLTLNPVYNSRLHPGSFTSKVLSHGQFCCIQVFLFETEKKMSKGILINQVKSVPKKMFQLVTKSEQVLFNISPGKNGELQHISKMPCKELPFLLVFIISFLIWLLPNLHKSCLWLLR